MEAALLAWYETSGRDLPWRRTRDPYAILVSEVMLQQTQVERVVPRYLAWLERWPTPAALAAASPSEVIRAWQGLGYNRRAVNLHRAACEIAAHGWPDDLTRLPGVGRYTADAIRSFVDVFIFVYVLLILAYILTSWIRLPYSPWLNRIQRFLYDVCEPYLRIFRRILPPFGPLDLSPMVAILALWIASQVVVSLLGRLD